MLKGGINLSVRTVSVIALGILMIVLMYVTFEQTVSSLIDSFLDELTFIEP